MNDHYEFDVFLGYHLADVSLVQEIAEKLKKAGLKVWLDKWIVDSKSNIEYLVNHGLSNSRVLILFISKNSVGSTWIDYESKTIRFRDPLNSSRRFVPVLLNNEPPPPFLENILCIEWSDDQKIEQIARLVALCSPPPELPSSRGVIVPRLHFRKRYSLANSVTAAKLSLNRERVSIGFTTGNIRLTGVNEIAEQREHFSIEFNQEHHGPIKSLDWHKSKNLLVSGGIDRLVCVWDIESGQCIRSMKEARDALTSVRFAEDTIVCASKDGNLYLWEETKIQVLRGHRGSVSCLEILKEHLVSGGIDNTIRLWSKRTGRCVRVLEGHTNDVCSLAISPAGDQLLSGSLDQTIRLWDLVTGMCINIFDAHTDAVQCLAWHPDGKFFASGGGDRTMRLWRAIDSKLLAALDGCESDVLDITFSGNTINAIDYKRLYEWQLDTSLTNQSSAINPIISTSKLAEQVLYTNAKVLLVGDSGAGKTGLAKRLAEGIWEESPGSTVGAWATQWPLPASEAGQADREIWLWDFGGQADQRLIHQLYMDETALAVLVFDAQRTNVFESLDQWNRDLIGSSVKPPTRLLVAGRVDASYIRISKQDIDAFINQNNFNGYLETSARTNKGCDELRERIIQCIDWDDLPWRSSPALFKRLKEQIVKLKDEGRILMRFNELRDALRLRLPSSEIDFSDAELKAVLNLLTGPGVVAELEFGAWVLFQPELINAYGQAVIATLRADPSELGCVNEQRVLSGDLVYGSFKRIPIDEERFVLLEMHRKLLQRGLCARELTDQGVLLVFPNYYKRNRPELTGHPALLVSYDFNGIVDEIYSTLVVQLNYTSSFKRTHLWQDAVDFDTLNGVKFGIKLNRRFNSESSLDIYCEPKALLADKIIFVKYVHDHLVRRAVDVTRRRHYVCQECANLLDDGKAVYKRLMNGKQDIGCPTCDARVKLSDDLELQYSSTAYQIKVRKLEDEVIEELDNESKERLLVGNVMSAVALAGHLSREKSVSDHGIDMEIEFKNYQRQASGQLIFLQLKSGDSYLRRRNNGDEIFTIKNPRHVSYWADQVAPVMLVIMDSSGEIRWMEIRDLLREEKKAGLTTKSFKFVGERFDSQSISKWRDKLINSKKISV